MRTTTDLLILAQHARAWLDKHQLPAPPWPLLPKEWPDAVLSPVWVYADMDQQDETLRTLLPDADLRCRALRMRHDPDERQPWVFVPGLGADENEVWLVHTKPSPASAPFAN